MCRLRTNFKRFLNSKAQAQGTLMLQEWVPRLYLLMKQCYRPAAHNWVNRLLPRLEWRNQGPRCHSTNLICHLLQAFPLVNELGRNNSRKTMLINKTKKCDPKIAADLIETDKIKMPRNTTIQQKGLKKAHELVLDYHGGAFYQNEDESSQI